MMQRLEKKNPEKSNRSSRDSSDLPCDLLTPLVSLVNVQEVSGFHANCSFCVKKMVKVSNFFIFGF